MSHDDPRRCRRLRRPAWPALAAAFDDFREAGDAAADGPDRGLSGGVRDRVRRSYRATAAGDGRAICESMVRSKRASPNAIGSFSAGLVEGVWPPASPNDPWLSRPMRHELGLDLPERRIGLSAHDFAQLLGADDVILSHAAKAGGAPAVASRFLHRLEAVAGTTRWTAAKQAAARYVQYAEALDRPDEVTPIASPNQSRRGRRGRRTCP